MTYQQGYRDGCRDAARLLRDVVEYYEEFSTIPFHAIASAKTINIGFSDTASAIEALDAPRDPMLPGADGST